MKELSGVVCDAGDDTNDVGEAAADGDACGVNHGNEHWPTNFYRNIDQHQ